MYENGREPTEPACLLNKTVNGRTVDGAAAVRLVQQLAKLAKLANFAKIKILQIFSGLVLGCIEVDTMFDLNMGKAFQDSVYSFGDLECAETRYFFDQLLDEEWNLILRI